MTHSIERLFGYEIRYLAYFSDLNEYDWRPDPCDDGVLRYEDDQLDEAEAEIAVHGGNLCSFPFRGSDTPKHVFVTPIISLVPDSEPVWRGHSAVARLQYREAERMAAE